MEQRRSACGSAVGSLLWLLPSGHLHCWVWSLSFSSCPKDSLRDSGQASLLLKSSTTIPGSLNKPLAIQTLLETEHIISIQPVSRRNFEVFLFFLVLGCINWTKKPIWATLVDHMSPHSIMDCGNFILLSLLLVHLFLPQVFLPLSLLWICTDTPFWKKPTSLAINFCSLPSLWRVSLASSWTSA